MVEIKERGEVFKKVIVGSVAFIILISTGITVRKKVSKERRKAEIEKVKALEEVREQAERENLEETLPSSGNQTWGGMTW